MSPRPHNQDGSAMIFVSVVGLVMSLAFGLFMTSTVLAEQRAVEAELAKSRAYWAQMGNFHYAMSRISYSRLCTTLLCPGKQKDTDAIVVLQAYFNELSSNTVWTYPDESSNYSITTTDVAAVDEDPTRQTYSGWIKATSAYTPSALVSGSSGKLPLMELRLCIGLSNSGDKCGNIDNNNIGNFTRYFSVNRLTNLPAP